MRKFIAIALTYALFSSCSFIRSTVLNENVYKTKDTLELIKVYNHKTNKAVPNDDTIYRILINTTTPFVRYTLVKDADQQYIKILPGMVLSSRTVDITGTYGTKNINNLTVGTHGAFDPSDYYFKTVQKKAELKPEQQYLAAEHVTAVPIVIPFKFRFNVPANLDVASINASVAYSFGVKFRINNNPYKDHYLRWIPLAIGLSNDTYLNRDSIAKPKYVGKSSISLTFSTGGALEFNKFNFGAFLGWDHMFGDKQNWLYQDKPWLGIGFGFTFGSATK